jgi:hypothetical protein
MMFSLLEMAGEMLCALWENHRLWRFNTGLFSALGIIGLGHWLLPVESHWRILWLPLLVGGAVAGAIWEFLMWRKK